MKLDEATRKWIKRHQRKYDDELEKSGMITGRKAVSIFSAMSTDQQRKIWETLFPERTSSRSLEHEKREDQSADKSL